jgi:hypothetical protein
MLDAYEIPGGYWEIYFNHHYSTMVDNADFGDFISEVLDHGMDIRLHSLESSCV